MAYILAVHTDKSLTVDLAGQTLPAQGDRLARPLLQIVDLTGAVVRLVTGCIEGAA
jgi:hypothetical protein